MTMNLYALDDIQNSKQAIAALENYADKVIDEFLEEPEGIAYIKKNPDEEDYVGEWFLKILELAYQTNAVTLPHITQPIIESLLTQALPQKLTSDEVQDTGNLIPELIAFWSFLDRAYQLSAAPSILKTLKKLKPVFPDVLKGETHPMAEPVVERNPKDTVLNSTQPHKSAVNPTEPSPAHEILSEAVSALNLGNGNSRSSSLDFDLDEIDFDREMQKLEQELALEQEDDTAELESILASELGINAKINVPESQGPAPVPLKDSEPLEPLGLSPQSESTEQVVSDEQTAPAEQVEGPEQSTPENSLIVAVSPSSTPSTPPPAAVIEVATTNEPFPPLNPTQIEGLIQQTITSTSPGPILQDIESFLLAIGPKGMTVSNKTQTIPLKVLVSVNDRMTNPVQIGLKRANQKNYGNIHGLVLLLRTVGLLDVTTKGKKQLLTVNIERINRWHDLNPTEQYCSLLTAWLLDSNIAMFDGRRSSRTEGDRVTSVWNRWFASGYPIFQNQAKNSESFTTVPGLHNLGLMEMFGLVTIQSNGLQEEQGWQINAIAQSQFGNAVMNEIMRMKIRNEVFFNGQQPSEKPNPIQDCLRTYFPEWQANLSGALPPMPEPQIQEVPPEAESASESLTVPSVEPSAELSEEATTPQVDLDSTEEAPIAPSPLPTIAAEEGQVDDSDSLLPQDSVDDLADLAGEEDIISNAIASILEELTPPSAMGVSTPAPAPVSAPPPVSASAPPTPTLPTDAITEPEPKSVEKSVEKPSGRGVYVIKVTLQEAERWISIGSEQNLFNLSQTILESVDFDNDHLDLFRYTNEDGVMEEITHPYNQGDRTTDKTTIRDLGVTIGSTLTYIFDLSTNWTFSLEVESVDTEDMRLKYLDVVDSQGAAPEQYGGMNFDSDDENW